MKEIAETIGNQQEKIKVKIVSLLHSVLLSFDEEQRADVVAALKLMFPKIDIKFTSETQPKISVEDFISNLSRINEKGDSRKKNGVYYTPKDVTEYIVANTYLMYLDNETSVFSVDKCLRIINADINSINKILSVKVLDPTCGAAEFLLSALQIKFEIAKSNDLLSDKFICETINTIYGNDIANLSIDLTKLRLFFYTINILKDKRYAKKIATSLTANTSTEDFVVLQKEFSTKYDIVIGNPPYVEYGKLSTKLTTNFGNSYADVLVNSLKSLNENGAIGFVIPVSFVSTARMAALREQTYNNFKKMYVLNFADRPDCLFDGVHQKLTILFGKMGNGICTTYSSSYTYWYKQERQTFLNDCTIYPVSVSKLFIPKIGCQLESEIYEKITQQKGHSIEEISLKGGNRNVYLNMRGCFWMKAFTFNPGSKEYKAIGCTSEMQPYLLCILNSSIYFLFWTIISDCWHVTKKELSLFIIPTIENTERFVSLAEALQSKLEQTKKYIGSKQTNYEYKHRECKKEIDDIDDALQSVFQLSDIELHFIKNYKINYRMSNGKV